MEKSNLTCPRCGRLLALIFGEIGGRRRIKLHDGVRARVDGNALGESLGWLKCPRCKTQSRFDTAYWYGPQ